MCNLAWHPVWEAVRRDALPCRKETVIAVWSVLASEGELAYRLSPAIIAAGLGFTRRRIEQVGRIMSAMALHGVLDEDGLIAPAWRNENDRRDVMTVTPLRQRPRSGAERQALWRENHPEHQEIRRIRRAAARQSGGAELSVTPLRHESYSLFPDTLQDHQKEKQPRETGVTPSDERFPELMAIWKRPDQMADARKLYLWALRHVAHDELLSRARRYLEALADPKFCMLLVRWLKTRPWEDKPVGEQPLPLPPQIVSSTDLKPRINWSALGDAWLDTRTWPPDIGPAPDREGCRMPFALLQRVRRAMIDRQSGERASA